jgi:AraC-like DNA-binding protein
MTCLDESTFRRLCRARRILLELEEEPRTIREIACESGISTFHFIRQFEALFGLTPHQIRMRARMDRAKLLLASGERSVTEVCMEVGMSSVGSFSDFFSKRVKTSPSEYKRRARTMIVVPGTLPDKLFPGCLSMMGQLPGNAFRKTGQFEV